MRWLHYNCTADVSVPCKKSSCRACCVCCVAVESYRRTVVITALSVQVDSLIRTGTLVGRVIGVQVFFACFVYCSLAAGTETDTTPYASGRSI